jgi:AraC-like DNA-binding protein
VTTTTSQFVPVRFSVNELPAKERVPHWREFLCGALMNLEIEPIGEEPFLAKKTCLAIPGVGISSGIERPLATKRSRELIARDARDDLAFLITNASVYASQRGRETSGVGGGALLMRCGEPQVVNFHSTGRILTLRIPVAVLTPMVSDLDAALMSLLPREGEPLRLLWQYVRLLEDNNGLTPELARLAATHIQDLVALAIGANRDARQIANGRGLRAARLRAIKIDIAENLAANVSPAAIATRHSVTPRYVHKLFESEGMTLSRFVLGQRLARVHRMLSDPRYGHQTIGAIAYHVGFSDLSTFNRAFRRQFGATPSDARAAARRE